MNIPANLKYTSTHEWARLEKDGTVTIGITDHAQDLLGDMVFVETPSIGKKITAGKECGVVESVKAASDIYAPISGEVIAINSDLESAPEKINTAAYDAWMFRIKPDNQKDLDSLLDSAGYQNVIDNEAH